MAETILVTGGAGFIGSNFVRFILTNTDNVAVINLDSLTYSGNLENLADVENDPRYTFVRGDIRDRELLRGLFRQNRISGVIHFAAESHVDRSIISAKPFVDTNIDGTLSLLETGRECGVERFLQVSTDEVYGSLGAEGKFTEETPLAPNSPYSASKASADMLVRAFVHTHDFPAIITRCSNNYGPYQFPEKLIPLMILNAMEDRSLPVYGDGMNVRDWIYVEDHCEGVWEVYRRGRVGEVYNLGGDCEKPNIEIVRSILSLLDKPESLISYVKDRPGHDRRYAMDIGKIQKELGWHPKTDFETGLEKTVRWYRENPAWCASVRSGEYRSYINSWYEKLAL